MIVANQATALARELDSNRSTSAAGRGLLNR
jgi:hypothetical protein